MRVRFVPLLLLLVAAPLAAQEPAPPGEAEAREAIAQLRSPYCPGLMLEVCPSAPAELLRDSIRAMAAQGSDAGEIVEDVLARHGEEWRAVPKKKGVGLWAWIAPPAALLLGALLVVGKLRGMRGRDPEPAPGEGTLDDEDRARLAAALAEYERSPEVEG